MAMKKATFITELDVRLMEGDKVWMLESPLIYYSPLVGRIQVPAGFYTDFASVPRLPIAFALFGDKAHREGVIHDYLFRKDAIPETCFSKANRVFLEAMESRGKSIFVRWPMYLAVCVFSYPCFHKRSVGDKL